MNVNRAEALDRPAQVTIEALVREHGAFVWRSVRRLGVTEADADDVTQLVFLRARDRLPEIQPDTARGFLYRLALGFASNHRRSQHRRRETSLEEEGVRDAIERARTDDPAARIEQRALLDLLLESLPVDLRAVLVLHEGEEMTAPEIADLLGIPVGTVASRLRRAREELRAALVRARLRNPTTGGAP
ncbi:MAG: sigma-70 family RNA polymerase sigma factor [Polyangiaceae bacterium]